ncbi:MAG: pyruvate kinase [Cyclobacteriaceae bacterium]
MKINPEKTDKIIAEIDAIINTCIDNEIRYKNQIDNVHPDYKISAINLVHYLALRSHDLRVLQKKLGNLGLSRLAKAESHVMASLLAIRHTLLALNNRPVKTKLVPHISIKKGQKIIRKRNKELFGYKSKNRSVRIMVTQPSESASDFDLVYQAMLAGMNTVRINCAHDEPDDWLAMISHARKSMDKIGRKCKITMDLGGPKIRTGGLEPGPKVVHLRPERDDRGIIIKPTSFAFYTTGSEPPNQIQHCIPVEKKWLQLLKKGSIINFADTRGKDRSASVMEVFDKHALAICHESAFIETGIELTIADLNGGQSTKVGEIPPVEQSILLKPGDELLVHKAEKLGAPAVLDASGKIIQIAHIPCTSDDVFINIAPGDIVFFDDGKIEAIVDETDAQSFKVRIIQAKAKGTKLRADKGINFPGGLGITGLTSKDREDLAFVAKYADVVNMSFVNVKQDIEDLLSALRTLHADNKLGVILKIETQSAFKNLPEILLTAMQVKSIGVMIARGDLAIECGWRHIGRIQEEILWMCAAAHVPTVWATQVLENLAKKGIPSRAEITDAVMAQRADCVMLNKGPYIVNAIKMLDAILKNMQEYQEKKAPLLPPLETNAIST